MVRIRKATEGDIPDIKQIAEATWWPSYSSILPDDQLKYMLKAIYSVDVLKQAMGDGQDFIMIDEDNRPVGFAGFAPRPEEAGVIKLHKLYVLPETQGKGYGRLLLEEVMAITRSRGLSTLDLNVNRYNPAKAFYERLGFKVVREEDIPIGQYWMNDYVMRISLA